MEDIYYSLVIYADSLYVEKNQSQIEKLLNKGIKIVIFTNQKPELDINDAFVDAKLIFIYQNDHVIEEPLFYIDGNKLEEAHFISLYPEFNYDQFKIEHAPLNENIIVKAGAGTGKTTVMVDRIMHLLLKGEVDPASIVMITFTRNAANNMQKKLRELLFKRFHATKSPFLLKILERLNEMRIQTIDSFSKGLLSEVGSLLGFGLNMQIKSFTKEKKEWIEEELDNYFKEELSNRTASIHSMISPLKEYELIDIIYNFWENLDQRGFSTEAINEHLDFGTSAPHNELINNLLQTMIKRLEKKFTKEKRILNAVSMGDLTRHIDEVRREYGVEAFKNNVSQPISYVLVDEFQDSDDMQINLIAALHEAFNSNLFVVGDIKQSIYRFRGANHTAFKMLKTMLSDRGSSINDEDYYLNQNYRTISPLLNEMTHYFEWWAEKGFLEYNPDTDTLKAAPALSLDEDENDISLTIVTKREDTKDNMQTHITPIIQQRFQLLRDLNQNKDDNEKEKMAVLTRTIEEARQIEKWCKQLNPEIPTTLKVAGSFYATPAVRHFNSLLLALLYPDNSKYLANLLDGPYGQGTRYLYGQLIHEHGYMNTNANILKNHCAFSIDNYVNELKIVPVLSVLRRIIQETGPYNWIYSRKLDELKEIYSEQGFSEEEMKRSAENFSYEYKLTIGKLFEIIHQSFSDEFVTIHNLSEWLSVQIATNREEEEIQFHSEGGMDSVEILTAHRAKGLEYHTVIIPFTERQFINSFSKIIFDDKKEKVGWRINKPGHEMRQNDYFSTLVPDDDIEIIQEETRLLYVAMTRAKSNLVVVQNTKNDAYGTWTWSKLLSQTKR